MQVTLSDLQHTYSAKTDEELLVLHRAGTLTEVAYDALEAELARRTVPVPSRPPADAEDESAQENDRHMTLAAHWRGDAPLASAYWLLGTLGFWVIYGASVLIQRIVPALLPVALAVLLGFLVFAWVAIWRCWKNCTWSVWGYLARMQVILFVVITVAVIVRLLFEADVFTGAQQRSIFE